MTADLRIKILDASALNPEDGHLTASPFPDLRLKEVKGNKFICEPVWGSDEEEPVYVGRLYLMVEEEE